MSVTVLFEEGRLRDYIAGTDEDALLRTAIRLHNAYRLPEEMDDRTRMFCQILRDADQNRHPAGMNRGNADGANL